MIAVDFGFGNIKYYFLKNGVEEVKGIIPSYIVNSNGEGILIGEKALKVGKAGKVLTVATVEDLIDLYPKVLRYIGETVVYDRNVAVGLPLSAWQVEKVRRMLAEKLFENGYIARVYPQAAAVGFAKGGGLIVDFGFNTVIACLVEGNNILYNKTYYRAGAVALAKAVEKELQYISALTARTFSMQELGIIMNSGSVMVGLDEIEFNIKEKQAEYIKATIRQVISDLKAEGPTLKFDKLYLIGGFAKNVDIQSNKVQIIKSDKPIFENVKAFYQLAEAGFGYES